MGVLVVLLSETRGWELTAESLSSNVVDELDADLALCVGDHETPNPLYERARYVWRLAEPDDWADAYDRAVGNSSWRVLLAVHEMWLGGIEDPKHPQIGSGAIGLYFRRFLRESLEQAGLVDTYDWIVVTRSDMLWPGPHPHPRYLSNRRIYVFDGEHYGGVSDRYVIVPRRFVRRFLSVPDPVFADPLRLKQRIDRTRVIQGWSYLNPERFLALRLADLGLWRRVAYLPYLPFAVRSPGGKTRWSQGELDDEQGFFVKYPSERERSQVTERFLPTQRAWRQYLSRIRGARLRRELRRAYPSPGEFERHAFPLVRGLHKRTYRRMRWDLTVGPPRVALRTNLTRIGRRLRRIPGMSPLLDARIRRMERRAQPQRADDRKRESG